jgi:hypothetical protein
MAAIIGDRHRVRQANKDAARGMAGSGELAGESSLSLITRTSSGPPGRDHSDEVGLAA